MNEENEREIRLEEVEVEVEVETVKWVVRNMSKDTVRESFEEDEE